MKLAKVSVLIVTYNSDRYIENTINSVFDQSYNDFTIMVLDNNSKDNTRSILIDLKKKHPNKIKLYFNNNNLGAFAGLNYLLDKTDSEYIAILDHDDLWYPSKLAKQINFLDINKDYIATGSNVLIYYEKYDTYMISNLPIDCYFTNHSSLVFRNTNKRYPVNNFPSEYAVDSIFIKKYLCQDKKLLFNFSEPLTLHLINKFSSNYSQNWLHTISARYVINIKSYLLNKNSKLFKLKNYISYFIEKYIGYFYKRIRFFYKFKNFKKTNKKYVNYYKLYIYNLKY